MLLQALTEKQIGRRDQAARWLWHLAEYSREVHEEYAVQRWPETKRLLGLLVNSAGAAHARNARRLVQAARKQDRRLSAALLAAALAHTPEAQQVLDGARMRMARKPSALARELLKNFPKGKRRRGGRRRRKKGGGDAEARGRRGEGDAGEGAGDAAGPPDDDDAPRRRRAGRADAPRRRRRRRPGRARARSRTRPASRTTSATPPSARSLALQVHLARVERDATVDGLDDQGAARVHAGRGALLAAVRPAHRAAEQRVAGAPGGQDLVGAAAAASSRGRRAPRRGRPRR